jgi:hypothetical protein
MGSDSRVRENKMSPRQLTDIPTSFDKELLGKLSQKNLIAFYWKVLNSLDMYASEQEHQTHDDNIAYLTRLIGYDPICE